MEAGGCLGISFSLDLFPFLSSPHLTLRLSDLFLKFPLIAGGTPSEKSIAITGIIAAAKSYAVVTL